MIDLVCSKGFEGMVANITEVNIANDFDLVKNNFAIDRVDKPVTMLNKISSSIKKPGKAIVTTPFPILHPDERELLRPRGKEIIGTGTMPVRDVKDLVELLRDAGLRLRAWSITTCLQKDPHSGLLEMADFVAFLDK